MAYSDLELLARIVECEAGGEGETGMKAVASVVMNRVQVDYGEYGRLYTIREVVYQRGQFTCAMETVGAFTICRISTTCGPPRSTTTSPTGPSPGNRLTNLGFALWFYNPFSVTCRDNFPSRVGEFVIRIGDHCFTILRQLTQRHRRRERHARTEDEPARNGPQSNEPPAEPQRFF